ncbi:MAG TPA: HesB/YadR/YfhF-family protein [Conexibacter sp.]
MLAITTTAADAIRGIVASPDIPAGAGLRIAPQPGSEEESNRLEVTIAAMPAESDQVLDEEGARVFLEEHAAELLDDKMLDAQIDGQQVGFFIGPQA